MLNLSLRIASSFVLRCLIFVLVLYEIPQLYSIVVVVERARTPVLAQNSTDNHLNSAPTRDDATMLRSHDSPDDGIRFFNDYKLARIIPHNKRTVDYLQNLFLSEASIYQLDFWQPPSRVGALVDVTVAPEDARSFFSELDARNIEYFIVADNLQSLIVNERTSAFNYDPSVVEMVSGYHYDRYNPLTTIEFQIFRLRDENPNLITIFDIGRTHENRSIYTVKVSLHATRNHPWRNAPTALWIDAGIHAREWIAPATAMNFLRILVNGYNTADPDVRHLLESTDWYVTPVLNPDGYEYSHTKNRMWRKNRRPANLSAYSSDACAGVDLNRNFNWYYADRGSSSDPCHGTYHGPAAFSEPESQAVRDFLQKVKVHSFITLHSYSQMWLIPFGHKRRTYPSDFTTQLQPLAIKATEAISRLYGTKYAVGTAADLLCINNYKRIDEASGSSHDYAKGVLKIPFAFLIELKPQRGVTSNGFLLPESEIMTTSEETWMAVKVVVKEIIAKFGQPSTTTPEIQTDTDPSFSFSSTTSKTTSKTPILNTTEIPTFIMIKPGIGFRRQMLHLQNRMSNSNSEESDTLITRLLPNAIRVESQSAKPLDSSEVELYFMIGVRAAKQIDVANVNQELLKNIPPTLPPTESIILSTETSSFPAVNSWSTRKTFICHDFSHYCRWWKMHSLCKRSQVQQKCKLSCLKECQI